MKFFAVLQFLVVFVMSSAFGFEESFDFHRSDVQSLAKFEEAYSCYVRVVPQEGGAAVGLLNYRVFRYSFERRFARGPIDALWEKATGQSALKIDSDSTPERFEVLDQVYVVFYPSETEFVHASVSNWDKLNEVLENDKDPLNAGLRREHDAQLPEIQLAAHQVWKDRWEHAPKADLPEALLKMLKSSNLQDKSPPAKRSISRFAVGHSWQDKPVVLETLLYNEVSALSGTDEQTRLNKIVKDKLRPVLRLSIHLNKPEASRLRFLDTGGKTVDQPFPAVCGKTVDRPASLDVQI